MREDPGSQSCHKAQKPPYRQQTVTLRILGKERKVPLQTWEGAASLRLGQLSIPEVPLLTLCESFRVLRSVRGGYWSALVKPAVNHSLTQHRVAFPGPHPIPYAAFRNVTLDTIIPAGPLNAISNGDALLSYNLPV